MGIKIRAKYFDLEKTQERLSQQENVKNESNAAK